MEDALLLTRAVNGDRRALATLYDRHAATVYGYALRLTGNSANAEDITQDTFLLLLRSTNYDASRSFQAWLLTVTRNASLDVLRRRQRRGEVSLEPEAIRVESDGLERVDAADAIGRALATVPREYREALWLCDAQGFSYQEAAEIMVCDVNTVGSRLSRGRQALRDYFARKGHAV